MQKENKEEKIVYFKYYQGISKESKTAVKNTVKEFYDSVGNNSPLINGYTFSVVNEYKDVKAASPFTRRLKKFSEFYTQTMGATIPPELNKGKKEIILQLKERKFPRRIWKNNVETKYIECAILHEIGHNFDNYYGQKFNKDNDNKSNVAYMSQYLLSNNPKFVDAINMDLEILERTKNNKKFWNRKKAVNCNNILPDISVEISFNVIETTDTSRSELFAQLFAYAFGKDDGKRQELVTSYYNSYVLVKNYIKEYLTNSCK